MSITIRGRGFPLVATVDSDAKVSLELNGVAIGSLTSSDPIGITTTT